jgi:hypothetical protein
MAKTFTEVFQEHQYNLPDVVKKSQTWFQQQARLLGREGIAPQKLIRTDPEQNRARIQPGELYLFHYDAKHQDTLPYWDMYPLVFPFRRMPDGFIGLNMHYLPYAYRVRLLDRLMSFKSNKHLTDTTKLKFQWETISGVSKFKIAEPCVHRYLTSHVQSPFKKIGAEYWATAMMLPVERFVGANKMAVWNNSIRTR